jgi:hypothetical protein
MAQDVSFKVERYLQGRGPDRIEFTQHVVDRCDALSADVGFGEAILFLSKNEWRGVWATAAIRIRRFEDEARVFEPDAIKQFTSFDTFDNLLSTYGQPFEWSVEKTWDSYETLEALRRRGLLDYAVKKREWPEIIAETGAGQHRVATSRPRRDEDHAFDEYYAVTMYKYIRLETLLAHDF